jgi:hypothetical protein
VIELASEIHPADNVKQRIPVLRRRYINLLYKDLITVTPQARLKNAEQRSGAGLTLPSRSLSKCESQSPSNSIRMRFIETRSQNQLTQFATASKSTDGAHIHRQPCSMCIELGYHHSPKKKRSEGRSKLGSTLHSFILFRLEAPAKDKKRAELICLGRA